MRKTEEKTVIQWGLCCIFRNERIRFRRASAAAMLKLTRTEQLRKLDEIARENAGSLSAAFAACVRLGIGAFRINSELLPLATHPVVGYRIDELENAEEILKLFACARRYAATNHLRLSLHPDQYVVLNSPRREVVESSLCELLHQTKLAELCGAAEINLHPGGVYGDRRAALQRLRCVIAALPRETARRLTLENDDHSYAVADLIDLCGELEVPLTYDVHHHRVHPDFLSVEAATELAAASWAGRGETPHFHLSSPALPWHVPGNHRPHAEFVDVADFPACWRNLNCTVDVEAKAGEVAVIRLRDALALPFGV